MDNKVQKKLDALIKLYSKNLPDKIIRIEALWQEQQQGWNLIQFQDFHREVHSLCGSAGTYGYTELSKTARQMEIFLKKILSNKCITPEDHEKITTHLNQLKSVLDLELAKNVPALDSNIPELIENKCVYVMEQDEVLMDDLRKSLIEIGFDPYPIQDLITLKMAVKEKSPIAMIIDTYYLVNSNIQQFLDIQKEQLTPIHLFCILPNGELLPRLDAIRSGCQAFFQKPVEIPQLMQIVNDKCSITSESSNSYRILIIDDSESLTNYYSLILNQAGMTTRAITNPLELLKELETFQPNLLLMDVYMPECTGFELAAILRQESHYTKIPIIFLSTEEDKDKKLFAISLGGDDFLTKPISPQHLISVVRSRSKRASVLNYYMTTDSLTGLLNHSSVLKELEIQLARAPFEHVYLSFIMVDIDHFKNVNDSYGHPVGDMVIKKLSDLFLTRLRRQDCVGRYGGEEFALILKQASPENSKKIVDEIRTEFSKYSFTAGNSNFSVSFSAGISCFDGTASNAKIILEQADQALYKAKQNGRNQVVIF